MPGAMFTGKLVMLCALAAFVGGCDGCRARTVPVAVDARAAALPAKLTRAPMDELAFVPHQASLVARLDISAMAVDAQPALAMLEFFVQSHQPELADVLERGGISLGDDVTSVLLVTEGSPAADGGASEAIAALGTFDVRRVSRALRRAGGRRDGEPAGGMTLYRWSPRTVRLPLAHERSGPGAERPLVVAVDDDLVLLGTPDVVAHAIAARSGDALDVRWSSLASELLALDEGATAWVVARPVAGGVLERRAPGLASARGQAWTGPEGDVTAAARFVFTDADRASRFQGQLQGLVWLARTLAPDETLRQRMVALSEAATFRLEESTVLVDARF